MREPPWLSKVENPRYKAKYRWTYVGREWLGSTTGWVQVFRKASVRARRLQLEFRFPRSQERVVKQKRTSQPHPRRG